MAPAIGGRRGQKLERGADIHAFSLQMLKNRRKSFLSKDSDASPRQHSIVAELDPVAARD